MAYKDTITKYDINLKIIHELMKLLKGGDTV